MLYKTLLKERQMEDADEDEDVSSYWMNLTKKVITLTTEILHIKRFIINKKIIIIIRGFTEEKTEGRRERRRRRQLLDKLKE
jgi:hypothetical protein